jgi:hypothetical protein
MGGTGEGVAERRAVIPDMAFRRPHQEKMAREREDYYLQMKARMLASVPAVSLPTL